MSVSTHLARVFEIFSGRCREELTRHGPTPLEVDAKWVDVRHSQPNSVQKRAKAGPSRSRFRQSWPNESGSNSVDMGPMLVKVGQRLPELNRVQPLSAKFRPMLAWIRQACSSWPDVGKIGSENVCGLRSGRMIDQCSVYSLCPCFGDLVWRRPGVSGRDDLDVSHRNLPGIGESFPKSVEIARHFARFAKNSQKSSWPTSPESTEFGSA